MKLLCIANIRSKTFLTLSMWGTFLNSKIKTFTTKAPIILQHSFLCLMQTNQAASQTTISLCSWASEHSRGFVESTCRLKTKLQLVTRWVETKLLIKIARSNRQGGRPPFRDSSMIHLNFWLALIMLEGLQLRVACKLQMDQTNKTSIST